MSTAHLTRADLKDLTGTPILVRQVEWLRLNGWAFELDTHGRPKIARAYYEVRMGITQAAPPTAPSMPDWSSYATSAG